MTQKHIIAGSGGFVYNDWQLRVGPILKYAFQVSGKERPKFCLIATARGDDRSVIASFYNACSFENVQASHLELFPMPNHDDVEAFILSQDVIWVGGGSVANLLAVWRVHGLDKILKKAWEKGIILTGQSAGSICWNVGGVTDSFGMNMQPVTSGLGFLPYTSGVHYNTEEQRRPLIHGLIADGTLPDGYATDDGVNIHFIDQEFHKAVSDRPDVSAYRVFRKDDGSVDEETITPEPLAF
jgi:peptidase E